VQLSEDLMPNASLLTLGQVDCSCFKMQTYNCGVVFWSTVQIFALSELSELMIDGVIADTFVFHLGLGR